MGRHKRKFAAWTTNLQEHYVPKKKKAERSSPEDSEDKENVPEQTELERLHTALVHQNCRTHRVRMSSRTLFQRFTNPQAAKARVMTHEGVIDEEAENPYQQTAGFLPVDDEAALEEIGMAKIPEIAEADPFAGLYHMDSDTDDAYTDYESDAGVEALDESKELRVQAGDSIPGEPHGDGYCRRPPTVPDAQLALEDLTRLLHPPRQKQNGEKAVHAVGKTSLDPDTLERLEDIRNFLWRYCDFDANDKPKNPSAGAWTKASVDVADYRIKGPWRARTLRATARAYIRTRNLPTHSYNNPRESRIDDEVLSSEIQLHLQGVGKYARAQDIVDFTKKDDVQKRHGFTKPISLATSKRWMAQLGYRWTKEPKGQYQDGHERVDVVEYRQKTFLPAWSKFEKRMRVWTDHNIHLKVDEDPDSRPDIANTVVWFHDESTFYAHDRRTLGWFHEAVGPKPQAKGEGVSLMVAHFVSADYGYLQSPDGTETARVLFKAGKGRDGYYTNERIIQHAEKAIQILQKYYPNDDHVLIFDNATTHVKRADNALSARHMPKNPSRSWGVSVLAKNDSGAIMYRSDGKPQKIKVPMEPGRYANGESQSLYFPDGHEKAGWFKGMAQILRERGFEAESMLQAECKGFHCPPDEIRCCCRRFLYNRPDFAHVKSVLEMTCHAKNVQVLFLPKFHCELNFIEQVWGYAKRVYRQFPPSSKESDLERNVIQALDSVSLVLMRR